MRKNQGITLIVLIITIIVMLILVAVSVNILIKSNLIGAAEKATDKYKTASEEEANGGAIEIDGKKYNSIEDYINGKEYINWNEILADATATPNKYKHSDQSSTNGDIGIGTDGKPVNLDLWTYGIQKTDGNMGITLSGNLSCSGFPGYQNSNITEDGKIIGTVPQYIKLTEKTEFYPVINMMSTFHGCTSLITAPIIPTTVTWMGGTFSGCTNLITAPTISSSVTGMPQTFYNCIKLQGTIKIDANPTRYDGCFKSAATEGTGLVVTGESTMLDELIGTKSDNSNITKGE